jgi:hypothetical protein
MMKTSVLTNVHSGGPRSIRRPGSSSRRGSEQFHDRHATAGARPSGPDAGKRRLRHRFLLGTLDRDLAEHRPEGGGRMRGRDAKPLRGHRRPRSRAAPYRRPADADAIAGLQAEARKDRAETARGRAASAVSAATAPAAGRIGEVVGTSATSSERRRPRAGSHPRPRREAPGHGIGSARLIADLPLEFVIETGEPEQIGEDAGTFTPAARRRAVRPD